MVAKNAGLRVGGDQDRADRFNTRGIRRDQFLPQRALTGLQIQAVDAGGQFSRLIQVERFAVAAESDGLFAGVESGNKARLAAAHGIEVSLLVWADSGDPLRVG